METDCKEIIAKYLHTTRQKKFAFFQFFLITHQVTKNLQFFPYFKWHGQGLFKIVYFIMFWTFFVWQTFSLYYNQLDFAKKSIFANSLILFADSKSRASNDPPPSVSQFSSTPAGIGLSQMTLVFVKQLKIILNHGFPRPIFLKKNSIGNSWKSKIPLTSM